MKVKGEFVKDNKDRLALFIISGVILSAINWLLYKFAGRYADKAHIEEVLKQLVTFSSLIVTLIFAVLIPRLIHDREKRSTEHDKLIQLCRQIHTYRSFIYNLCELMKAYLKTIGVDFPDYLRKKSTVEITSYHIKITTPATTKKWGDNYNLLQGDVPDPVMRNLVIAVAYMNSIYSIYNGIRSDGFASPHEEADDILIHEDDLWQIYRGSGKIITVLGLGNIVQSQARPHFDNALNTTIAPWLAKGTVEKFNNLSLPPIDSSHMLDKLLHAVRLNSTRTRKAAMILINIYDTLSPRRYLHLFISSFGVLMFGTTLPLSSLLFNFSESWQRIIATTSVISCLSFLMLFLYDLYDFLGDNTYENLKRTVKP